MLSTGFVSADVLRNSLTTYRLYVLRDPRTNGVRYVGCCQKPVARINGHINGHGGRSPLVGKWVDSLTVAGLRPAMEIVGECIGKASARRAEKRLIEHWFSVVGHDLLNSQHVPCFVPVKLVETAAARLTRILAYDEMRAEAWERSREQYRRTHGVGLNGVYFTLGEWAKKLDLSREGLRQRLKKMPLELALTTPRMTPHRNATT